MKIGIVSAVVASLLGAVPVLAANQAQAPSIKRATSGVCYEPGNKGYQDVRSYKAFESLEACVNAGGRLPNMQGFGPIRSEVVQQAAERDAASKPSAAATVTVKPAPVQSASVQPLFDTDQPGFIKKSRNNICHESSSASYAETVHFAAYGSLQDCLQSGGRKVAGR